MLLSEVREQLRIPKDPHPPEVKLVVAWIARAAALPGRSPVRLAIFMAGEAVRLQRLRALDLGREPLEQLGMSRSSLHEAIIALENERLIKSYRRKGRRAVAEIILDEATPAEAHRDLAS